jgi:hypothetical protein
MDVGIIRIVMLVIAVLLVAGVALDHNPGVTGLLTGQYELQPDWSEPNNMVTNSEACRDVDEGCMWDPEQFKCVCVWEK